MSTNIPFNTPGFVAQIEYARHFQGRRKHAPKVYAPQTKICEGGTKDEIQIVDILFNGS
jgi:hypothetical protein